MVNHEVNTHCDITGNLGFAPETLESGVVRLSVGCDWWDTGGVRQPTDWFRVDIFTSDLSDWAYQFLKKGDRVHVWGVLHMVEWVIMNGKIPIRHAVLWLIAEKIDKLPLLRDTRVIPTLTTPADDVQLSEDERLRLATES